MFGNKNHIKQHIRWQILKKYKKTKKNFKKSVDFGKVVSYKTFHRQGRASSQERARLLREKEAPEGAVIRNSKEVTKEDM